MYLRIRREAVNPAEVGFPAGTRRRTPGLCRADLATLAGISVDYLVRLEQGRDRHPSPQVLAALAGALRFSSDERLHLRLLAKATSGDGQLLCPAAADPLARSVRPTVQALLDRLEPTPAFLANRLSEVLALTTGLRGSSARLVCWMPSRPAWHGSCSPMPGLGRLPRLGPRRRRAGRQPQARVLPSRPRMSRSSSRN